MKINFKGKAIEIPGVKECKGLAMGTGLMLLRKEKAKALLFKFKIPTRIVIHSFFVFFPFVAIWLDDKNKVMEIKKVKPFVPLVSSRKSHFQLVEIPTGQKYQQLIKILVDDRKI